MVYLVCGMLNRLNKLDHLEIPNNRQQKAESCDLLGLAGLRIPNVAGNSLAVHTVKFLTHLDKVNRDDFRLCCQLDHRDVCIPEPYPPLSCHRILINDLISTYITLYATLGLLVNTVTLLFH